MSGLRNPAKWLIDLFAGDTGGDVRVTSETMLGSSAIWYAINTIAGDLGKMPLERRIANRDGRGSESRKDAVWRLLRDEPNGFQTTDVFKEQIQGHALGWGNGRAAIIRTGTMPKELIPLRPDATATYMVAGEKLHVTCPTEDDPLRFAQLVEESLDDPMVLLQPDIIVLHDRDVLHIQGFGSNGFEGYSIAKKLKDVIGIDLQAQRYANRGMKKGFAGQLMLEAPAGVLRNEDEAKKFLDGFNKRHANEKDAEKVGLLREGITANVLNMSNKDSQFIDQRKFSRQDAMLLFGLQHIPGDDSSVSYNSLEQKQLAYLASCLDRWLIRWEMQCDCKLRTDSEKRLGRIYHKFNRGSWLATDTQATQVALSGYVQSEILSKNEARDKLDLNPVEGGDEFKNPAINPESNAPPQETDNSIVEDRLTYLLELETERVIEASGGKDFGRFIESFYAKWPLTLLDNGATTEYAKATVSQHKKQLIDTVGAFSSADKMRELVTGVTDSWK